MMIENLPFVKYSNRKNLPAVAGVYFAVTDQVDYVGEADNLRQRWQKHEVVERMGAPALIYYLVMPGSSKIERCWLEREQIRRFQPRFNRTGFRLLHPTCSTRGSDQWAIKDVADLRRRFALKGCDYNAKIAQALGVSRNAITNWLLHGKPLYGDNARKVATYLGCSLDDLFQPRNSAQK